MLSAWTPARGVIEGTLGSTFELSGRGTTQQDALRTLTAACLAAISGGNIGPVPALYEIASKTGIGELKELRSQQERRMAIVAEVSRLLCESLDLSASLDKVARYLVGAMSRGCVIEICDEEGKPVKIAIAHQSPTHEATLREQYSRRRAAQESDTLITPIETRGRGAGALALLGTSSAGGWDPEEREFVSDIARRIGLFVDNAGLHVLLLALQFGHLARQLLVLAAQARELGAQLLDLVGQIEQAASRGGVALAGFGSGRVRSLLVGLNLLAQLDDRPAGLIVTEQGMRLQGPQGGRCHGARAQQAGDRAQTNGHGAQR